MTRYGVWLGLGLALRILWVLKLGGRQHQIDELAFASAAKDGMGGGVMPPVPVYFYRIFFWLGSSWVWPRLAQAFVSTATAWVIGRWADSLFKNERATRLALALACVYPFFIYYSGMLMSETLYVFFVCVALWRLERNAPLAGLAFALAALCRAEGAFIAGPILLLLGLRVPKKSWLAALLAFALPLAAWCARNRSVVGAFALDVHGGMALLHGNEYFALNEQDTLLAQREIEKQPFFQQDLPVAAKDALFKRRAFDWMKAHPGLTLKQWARKAVNFWRFYPRPEKSFIENPNSHPSAGLPRWLLLAISLLFEPLLILGGLWGAWRRRDQWPVLLWVLGTMGIHVLSVSQMRYRLPVMPVLILMLAASVPNKDRSKGPGKTSAAA